VDSRVLSTLSGYQLLRMEGEGVLFFHLLWRQGNRSCRLDVQGPKEPYGDIAGYFAFYPSLMDRCTVDGEIVKSQSGDFYGGWITPDVSDPSRALPVLTGGSDARQLLWMYSFCDLWDTEGNTNKEEGECSVPLNPSSPKSIGIASGFQFHQ
jgi:hypothetical protein